MTAITAPVATESTGAVRAPSWKSGLVTGVVAGLATVIVAVVARAVDVPLEIQDQAIPVLGFAQMVLLSTVIGIVLARQLARRAGQPRSTFVRTTVVLTVLSCVPSVLADATVATRFTLVVTHLVAAAIVIPRLASRLSH